MRMHRRVPLPAPDPATPWRAAEFCVVDLETTGLDLRRDEVVSFGAVVVRHGRIPCGETLYRPVRPGRAISVAAMTVHGLRAADLEGAPPLGDVLGDLVERLTGRVLVAHAAWVERAFLDRALRPRGRRLHPMLIDTAALLRAAGLAERDTGREPHLESAARRLGLPVHTPHHALGDAFTTAQLLLALATRLERSSPRQRARPLTAGQLVAVSRHHGH
ncbi:3'-5' exonuclease [Dactylosporangium vinaceum]|uniref:PolC-type DNA polymerase III n=1 Tax=Dactylosporangium vinaceum TaxID=53362 RepID=A0ABV5MQZ9_9ACTN|nr:exonuclease domain-containing protein [Dactylosporangium vinaceum]